MYYDISLALPWHPYSWAATHGPNWSEIIKVPLGNKVFFDRWTPVASGFMIFIFFGFGRDATRMYTTIFWYLGLGHCFSGIKRPSTTPSQATATSPGAESGTTLVGSIGSRAKSFFRKDSMSTLLTRASYNDIEKGSHRAEIKWSWLSSLFGRRRSGTRTDDDISLGDISRTSNTVLTNAWADSRSKDGDISPVSPVQSKDFIHVQQIISQQSEIHERV